MATPSAPSTFAKALVGKRNQFKPPHTLRDAAALIGVSHEAVRKWESGSGLPNNRHLAGLAAYLGLSLRAVLAMRDRANADLVYGLAREGDHE